MQASEQKAGINKMAITDTRAVFFGDNRYLRIVQQPRGKPEYVSTQKDALTSFQLASRFGSLGLLAHNFQAGKYFTELHLGDTLQLMDGSGNSQPFTVRQIKRFQALLPHSARSRFVDLETLERLGAAEVFKQVYKGDGNRVVLQTCIAEGNEKEWGRLFIICEPQEVTPDGA